METHTEISFTKVALPHGWLGNMSPYPITYKGKDWRTTEALFQALRFEDEEIIEAIRLEKSPMGAKMKAKKHKLSMVTEPQSGEDIDNMVMCIDLKLEQHPDLRKQLLETRGLVIVEDVTSRPRGSGLFWGAQKLETGWSGRNILGKVWMDARDALNVLFDSK
jgi:ribA/ribD-fused uncharacterized protein